MANETPFDLWDPARGSSLANRIEHGLHVMPVDLIMILEGDPDSVPDPLLRGLLVAALRGELRRPAGRPSMSQVRRLIISCAEHWISHEAEVVREDIRTGRLKHTRGDASPKQIAADRIAGLVPGNISGRTLLNEISSLKKPEKR